MAYIDFCSYFCKNRKKMKKELELANYLARRLKSTL